MSDNISKLEAAWEMTKEVLLEGYDLRHNQDGTPNGSKRETMEIVLENTYRSIRRSDDAVGHQQARNVVAMKKVILPVIRRVVPSLLANEIVGVQAMKGPVWPIETLRVPVGKGPSDAVTVEEITSAKSRPLAARWTFEFAGDAPIVDKNGNKIDIEAEIMAALAQEVVAEHNQELLARLFSLVGEPSSTFDVQDIMDNNPLFINDVHAALAIFINRQAQLISVRTRQAYGNWCVVSPTARTILKSASSDSFITASKDLTYIPGGEFAGILNGSMRVYVDQYARDDKPVLVGFKGNEKDAAGWYCPYEPLSSTGVTIDPQTFEPIVSFLSRYDYIDLEEKEGYLHKAADYLGSVGINTQTLSFL